VRFSASRIKKWSTCSLAAHYQYDVGLPRRTNAKAVFGQTMHKAAENFNLTGDLAGSKKLFLKEWGQVDPDYWPKFTSYAGLKAKGVEILAALENHYRFQDRRVIGTEIGFVVPFGDHELHGYIDLLETQRSGTGKEILKIVDYKTNSKDPPKSELALDPQFTAYAYAVTQKEFWMGMPGEPDFGGVANGEWLWSTLQGVPARCIWFSLWNGKQLDAGPRTDVDFGRLYRVCAEIERANEHKVYVPKIGEACTYCDFTEQCSMEIPVSIQALQNPDDPTRWV
jgi:hypothetical protein